ncbi:TonB-dependent receptor [Variovorax saccharolyticus]|uniref:TonB-dependent receptor n=1 Tax=Variovorax saccharolyticus TaxID=3053516 RepID=UPI002578E334|nr:TonB-dependent receptor [Variovorax sp. J31P216]MDM0024888.1 TonB-dependent receptor [Variovorax sp. J31P216]
MKLSFVASACLLLAAASAAQAQAQNGGSAPTLGEVTVSTPAGPTPLFEVAGSVDRVEGVDMRDSRLGVNLSESLSGVPGLQIQNRNNYAQDLQISIRGFGARSTFGVRGVRLYVDGIPATLPDGQGQTSNIDIGSVDHVEVLRGPFSALYGNSSGGVVQSFTETGEGPPTLGFSMAAASFGTTRTGVKASGSSGAVDYLLSGGHFETDGYRDHSAAKRDIINGKMGFTLEDGSRLTLVANSVRLDAQDPLGLTAEQYALNRRSAVVATQFDTRKTVDQTQAGLTYERRLDADNTLRLLVYGGQRKTSQYQAIPPTAQLSPTSAGGVIGLARDYGGLDLRWISRMQLADRPFELVAGLEYNKLREQRTGYENFLGPAARPLLLGVQGRLRRNETNEVYNLDPYLQGNWRFAENWTLEAGVRRSTVDFDSQDHYIVGANRNDSGSARYAETLPVASLRYQATRDLALYTSVGRGFETPTLNELSYRPDGLGGLNFALQPATNDSFEVGAKARLSGGLLTAALFKTRTSDEIVTATNVGGRATFQNAGQTTRDGFELAWQHQSASNWRTQLAYTWLDARYSDTFCSTVPCTAAAIVPAGNRIPGIAPQAFFASFGWVPPQGWRAGAELRALSKIEANDRNTVSAPGYAVAALFAGYVMQWQRWDLNAFARIDNLFDRQYIGSVIVNEGNARYYEPAPGRNWTIGMSAAYRF